MGVGYIPWCKVDGQLRARVCVCVCLCVFVCFLSRVSYPTGTHSCRSPELLLQRQVSLTDLMLKQEV